MRHIKLAISIVAIISSGHVLIRVAAAEDSGGVSTSTANKIIVNEELIIRFSPRARADVVREIAINWNRAEVVGVNNPLRIQHFFSEIAGETGGMTSLDEGLGYSPQQLIKTWPSRFNKQRE